MRFVAAFRHRSEPVLHREHLGGDWEHRGVPGRELWQALLADVRPLVDNYHGKSVVEVVERAGLDNRDEPEIQHLPGCEGVTATTGSASE